MKKTKLIAGILLMVLGVGVSIGSVALKFYEHNRYGMNTGQRMLNQRGMMGGNGFMGPNQRGFNVNPNKNRNQQPNPQPNPNPGPSPKS